MGALPPGPGCPPCSWTWVSGLRCLASSRRRRCGWKTFGVALAVGASSPVSPLSWLRGICVLVAGSQGEGEGGLRDSFLNFGFLVCE